MKKWNFVLHERGHSLSIARFCSIYVYSHKFKNRVCSSNPCRRCMRKGILNDIIIGIHGITKFDVHWCTVTYTYTVSTNSIWFLMWNVIFDKYKHNILFIWGIRCVIKNEKQNFSIYCWRIFSIYQLRRFTNIEHSWFTSNIRM